MLLVVAVAAAIVVLTAILSLIESAIIYVDDLRLATILRRKPANSEDIKYVIRRKDTHLSSMVVLITLISISGSSLIGAIAAQQMDDLGVALFTALLTYCMLVFAKILPKLFAAQLAEPILSRTARFVRVVCFVLRPVLKMTLVWVRFFSIQTANEPTRDELRGIIKHYNKSGVIDRAERKFAEQALQVNQTTVASLTSEEVLMVWLPAEATVAEVQGLICESPYKRYLVVDNNQVCGIVLYRHLTRCLVANTHDKKVGELAREVVVLEESCTLLEAVQAFKKSNYSVAILPGSKPESTRMISAKQVYQAILQAS